MNHDFHMCDLKSIPPFHVDILFVSESCRPYSRAGMNRMKDGAVEGHEDYFHTESILSVMDAVKPKCVIFEQVWGFALATSSADSTSPLQKLVEELKQRFSDWELGIFIVSGNVFMVLVRHRLFLVLVHQCAGGAETMAMMKRVVEAKCLMKRGQSEMKHHRTHSPHRFC